MADGPGKGVVLQDAFKGKGRKTVDFIRGDIIASLQAGDFEQFRGALLELREETAASERAQKEGSHLLARVLDDVLASEEIFRAFFPRTLRRSLCATLDNLASPIEMDSPDADTDPVFMPWSDESFAKLMDTWDRVIDWQVPFHADEKINLSILLAEQAAKRFARCAGRDDERAARYGTTALQRLDMYYADAQAGLTLWEAGDFVDPLMEMAESANDFISSTHIQHGAAAYLTDFIESRTPAGESNFYRVGVLQHLAELLDQHEKPPAGQETLYARIMAVMEKLLNERPDSAVMTSREFDELMAAQTQTAKGRRAANDVGMP